MFRLAYLDNISINEHLFQNLKFFVTLMCLCCKVWHVLTGNYYHRPKKHLDGQNSQTINYTVTWSFICKLLYCNVQTFKRAIWLVKLFILFGGHRRAVMANYIKSSHWPNWKFLAGDELQMRITKGWKRAEWPMCLIISPPVWCYENFFVVILHICFSPERTFNEVFVRFCLSQLGCVSYISIIL